jgi:DNA-binding SARP family transcriptional activator
MSRLDIQLLGGVRVFRDGKPAGTFPSRSAAALLAYLAVQKDRFVPREVLADRFWPDLDETRARKALRTALYGVRAVLEPGGVERGTYLAVDGSSVGLVDNSDIHVDVTEFDQLLGWCSERARVNQSIELLESAVRLYRGDFIDGHEYEWSIGERERLRLAYLAALEKLMDMHVRRGELHLAIAHGERILHQDPLREHIHRHLMVCHALQGDRPLAVRQYRRCEKVLDEELGIEPMDATVRLYKDIQSGVFRASRSADSPLVKDRRQVARPPYSSSLPNANA